MATNEKPLVPERKRRVFLETLRRTGKVNYSAMSAGYKDSSALRKFRNQDDEFAQEWDEALDTGMDLVEDEAIRRAVDGTREPVFYQGNVVGFKLNYSDQLMMFVMRGNRKKYQQHMQIEGHITGRIGVAVLPVTAVSMEDWEMKALRMQVEQQALPPPGGITADSKPQTIDVTPRNVTLQRN